MKLTTKKLKQLIPEEMENTTEGFVSKMPNPTFDSPMARADFRSGKLHSIFFQGLGKNKRAAFTIPGEHLSHKAQMAIAELKSEPGSTIGSKPGLAKYIASFVSNMSEEDIAPARVE